MLELLSPSVHPPLLLWAAADPTFHFCTVGTHIGGWYGLPVVGIVFAGSISVSLLSLLSSLPPSLHSSLLLLNSVAFVYDHDGSRAFVCAGIFLQFSLFARNRVASAAVPWCMYYVVCVFPRRSLLVCPPFHFVPSSSSVWSVSSCTYFVSVSCTQLDTWWLLTF